MGSVWGGRKRSREGPNYCKDRLAPREKRRAGGLRVAGWEGLGAVRPAGGGDDT